MLVWGFGEVPVCLFGHVEEMEGMGGGVSGLTWFVDRHWEW
jgi:hypothetical protein